MPIESAPYRAYLLRLWREVREAAGWRASLEDPHTGERLGFASLEQLFAFLLAATEDSATANRSQTQANELDSQS